MTPNVTPDASDWNLIVNTVQLLIDNDPARGLITIFVSVLVLLGLLVGATWAIVRIIKAQKAPKGTSLDQERFMKNVLVLVKQMTALNTERDRLSRRHEHIREHSLVRDHMTLVEGTQEEVRNQVLLEVANVIAEKNPNYDGVIADSKPYIQIEYVVDQIVDEVHTYIRRAAKENHMADKSEQDFFNYVSIKVSRIDTMIQQTINTKSNNAHVTETLKKIVTKLWPTVEPIYKRLFTEMRQIATNYYTLIETEETEYEQKWSEFIAMIPDLLMNGATETNA